MTAVLNGVRGRALAVTALALILVLPAAALPEGWRMNPQAAPEEALAARAAEPYASGGREGGASAAGRYGQRLLYGFEEGRDGRPLRDPDVDAMELSAAADYGVTQGRMSARALAPKGGGYATLTIDGRRRAAWGDFEYFAVDVYNPGDPIELSLDLRDRRTGGYPNRATLVLPVRQGASTLLFPLKDAIRNGKTGLSEDQRLPEDRVDRDGLTAVSLFFSARADRTVTLWLDNLRLLQEDAATPRMRLPLPGCTVAAFDFGPGGATVPGFTSVPADSPFDAARGYGFTTTVAVEAGGGGWPDLLGGTFVQTLMPGQVLRFEAVVPNGDYHVWLCAGLRLVPDPGKREFVLRVNDQVLRREAPAWDRYDGTDYLHRFLWTQYSERPHALWLDFITRMYEVHRTKIHVTEGRLVLTTRNHFLSGVVLLPGDAEADAARLAARFETIRRDTFERLTPPLSQKPGPPAATGAAADPARAGYDLIGGTTSVSSSSPRASATGAAVLSAAGAPGQNVFMKLYLNPQVDLGPSRLELGDLQGASGLLPAALMRGFIENDRYTPDGPQAMVLLPTLALHAEAGIRQRFIIWLPLPPDAAPGIYRGRFRFHPGRGTPQDVPVTVEVLPIILEPALPYALGLYYDGRPAPMPPPERADAVRRAQFEAMRELGFTSVTLNGMAQVVTVQPEAGRVTLSFDRGPGEAARAAGLAARAGQPLLVRQLDLARAIGRRLPGSAGLAMDRQPGLELRQTAFRPLWFDAMRQYKEFLDGLAVPYAVEIIDEPRESPNPWNRNLADTLTYGKWMGEVGLRRFVTPMADRNSGRDYTPLVADTDIISIHGLPGSERLRRAAQETGRDVWFYNLGMGRFSWGFLPWSQGAVGRFEWHWSWVDDWRGATGGYPGREWYNPFTPLTAYAPNAPITPETPGGFLYASELLQAAEGITDLRYLYQLERRVAAEAAGAPSSSAVPAARALLDRIRAEAAQGRQRDMDRWRGEMAELLAGPLR